MARKRKVVKSCPGSSVETARKKLKSSSKSRKNKEETAGTSREQMKVDTAPNASNSAKQQVSKKLDESMEPAKQAPVAVPSTYQAELDKELFSAIRSSSYSPTKSNPELLKQIIDKGGNVNAKDEKGDSLLLKALKYDTHDTIKLLLDSGANPNCTDAKGAGLLTQAVYNDAGCRDDGTYDTLKLLIDSGAKINQRNKENETVLWDAVRICETGMVKFLLQHGADATALDSKGKSILDCLVHADWDNAGFRKHHFRDYLTECSCLLQSHGAKFSQADLHEDSITLDCFLEYGGKKEAQLFVKHWKKGFRGCVKEPLHTAAGNDDPRVLSVLLKSGLFDVNQRDDYGYTPLHVAARSDYEYNLKTLLQYGADPNAETKTRAETAYSIARDQRNRPHMRLLLDYGAKKPSGSDLDDSVSEDEGNECVVS